MSKQDRKNERWQREQEQKAEHAKFEIVDEKPVDPHAVSEQRLHDLMLDPVNAPQWARPAQNQNLHAPAPATVGEIEAKITALEAEHADAVANLNRVQEEQRQALNDLLTQKRAAEDAEALARQEELPARLESTLAIVRSFVAPTDTAAPIAAPVDHIQRGRDALDRAQRRLRGEDVPEPEYVAPAVSEPPVTNRQDAIRARIAPNVAVAEKVMADLEAWTTKYGKLVANVHAHDDDEARYAQLRNDLLRGLPNSNTMLATQSVQLITGLLRSARSVMTVAGNMRRTIEDGTRTLEGIIARAETRGPLQSQGDHSTSYYDQEREIVGALHQLGTANADGIDSLHTMTRDIVERLERITALREECKGTSQPAWEFEDRGAMMASAQEAARRTSEARGGNGPDGRPSVGASWSVFGEVR